MKYCLLALLVLGIVMTLTEAAAIDRDDQISAIRSVLKRMEAREGPKHGESEEHTDGGHKRELNWAKILEDVNELAAAEKKYYY